MRRIRLPFPDVVLKPGPKILAAALVLAGFSATNSYPAVRDACGVTWNPSGAQIMLAVIGGESSGHAWCWHTNLNNTTDYGLCEINDTAHPQYFGAVKYPTQLNWANYAQNAVMAYAVHKDCGYGWGPWNAYNGGGYLAERYEGKSWMAWAQYGIDQMNTELATGTPLAQVASVDLDVLEYWA